MGLGQRLSLKDITCPMFLLAGSGDDITTKEQVFAAEQLVGTLPSKIEKKLLPSGHIGLFLGSQSLKKGWPEIAEWIKKN